jgi:response regulator RpfG family c-di-GMP phosphodiesterase
MLECAVSVPLKMLIIDQNADNGALLARTLLRKFPTAAVQLCGETETAIALAKAEPLTAIVMHRTMEDDASALTSTMRRLNPDAVIIVVSGVDRSESVLRAGATGFLNFEEWLRLGTLVANALELRDRDNQGKGPKGATPLRVVPQPARVERATRSEV